MALVRAARRLADPRDLAGSSVRASLVEQGPLSAQGVDLVLRDHLEIHPTDADLDALVGWAERAPRVHVVLSAHVFAGALRALALAVAAAPSVEVRMSRRESVFATALVDAVDDSEVTNTIRFVDRLRPRPCDEVHLYGRDATMREIARTLPPEVRVWAHGTGLGLAVVGASADLPEAAWQVVSDVVPFDQRGCLSPRVVVVEGSVERALCLARGLAEAMNRMRQRVPVGHHPTTPTAPPVFAIQLILLPQAPAGHTPARPSSSPPRRSALAVHPPWSPPGPPPVAPPPGAGPEATQRAPRPASAQPVRAPGRPRRATGQSQAP